MDIWGSSGDDSSSDSDDFGTGAQHERAGSWWGPHQRQTSSFKQSLDGLGGPEICQCVVQVLDFMGSPQLNPPVFLWAISWNVPELVSDHKARFA
jgi:hypothetical protein